MKLRRIVSCIVALAILTTVMLSGMTASAASVTISMDKTTFTVGETIKINYSGANTANNDWLCIYKKGDQYGSAANGGVASQQYAYINGNGYVIFNDVNETVTNDGRVAVDSDADDWSKVTNTVYYNTSSSSLPQLPVGEYYAIALGGGDWYQQSSTSTINFSVVAASSTPTTPSVSMDKTTFSYGETITVKFADADTNQNDWLCIYRQGEVGSSTVPSQQYAYIHGTDQIVFNDVNETVTSDGRTALDSDYDNSSKDMSKIFYNTTETPLPYLPAGNYYAVILGGSDWYQQRSSNTVAFTVTDDRATVSMDKTTFAHGESIKVSFSGANTNNNDWLCIYKQGEVGSSTVASQQYAYIDGDGYVIFNDIYDVNTTDGRSPSDSDYDDSSKVMDKVFYNTNTGLDYLAPGTYYAVILGGSNWYQQSSANAVTFTVTSVTSAPKAPTSVTYTSTSDKTGYADGTVTVTFDTSGAFTSDVIMYFADANGNALSDYSYLQKQPVASGVPSITFDLVKNTLIPVGAKKLIVYAANSYGVSSGFASVDLGDAGSYDFGDPLYTFDIVTDTHVTTDQSNIKNKNFLTMLKDVVKVDPDSETLVVIGDMTDTGYESEYQNLMSMYNSVSGAPNMLWAIGNHDFTLNRGNYTTQTNLFYKYAKVDNVYYDKWIQGNHFIFLGSEAVDTAEGINAIITDAQLNWLESKLAENYIPGKPIFVYCHQAIYNTVAGSLPGQGWDGIGDEGTDADASEQRLKAILAKYPEAMYFTGHSHWELNSVGTMYEGNSSMCTAFNAGSAGYLWTSYGNTYSGGYYYSDDHGGSQGFVVEVYRDKVVVRGRDFVEGKWMPSATFCVDLSAQVPTGDSSISTGVSSGSNVIMPAQGTTVSDLVKLYMFDYTAYDATMITASGSAASSSANVATGMKLLLNGTYYSIVVAGDVDGDGNSNAADVSSLLSYIRGAATLGTANLDAATAVSGNSSINILTATAMVNELLGID